MNGNSVPVIILLLVASVGLTGLLYTSTSGPQAVYVTGYAVNCDSVYDNAREKCERGPEYMKDYCETKAKYDHAMCEQEESKQQWNVDDYCKWQEKLAAAECDLEWEKAKMQEDECNDRAEEAQKACEESDGDNCDDIKEQMEEDCDKIEDAARKQKDVCEENTERVRRQCEDKPPIYKCEETDGGKNYETKGSTQDNDGRHDDYCTGQVFQMRVSKQLYESFCDGTASDYELIDCPNGCRDGACMKTPICTDADAEDTLYKGTTQQIAGPNLGEEIIDTCLKDGNEVDTCTGQNCQVKEGYCENNLVASKNIDCQYGGCANGKCLPPIEKCGPCQQDSDCQKGMSCKYGDCVPSSYSKTPITATAGSDGHFEFDPPQNIGQVFIRCKGLYGALDWNVYSGASLVQSGGNCQRIDQINSYFITNPGSDVTRITYNPNQLSLEWPTLYTDAECP